MIDLKRRFAAVMLATIACGPLGLLATPCAHAADSNPANWPARTVRIIVPFAAGGSTDALARLVGKKLADTLGQPFVVENRAGANGNLGAAVVANAPADGYTLLFTTTGPLVFNKLIYKSTPFDPAKDFAPIIEVSAIPLVVAANPAVPANTMADLIAYAKANPSKISYATSTNGSMGHLTAELFQNELGIKMTHIPYNGAPQAMNDLIAGRVDVSFDLLPIYTSYIKSKTLKALAVTTLTRVADVPDVATLAEQGGPKFEVIGWTALVGPAGVASETIEKLNRIINAFIVSNEGKSALANFGMEPRGGTPEDLAGLMASELQKWRPIAEKMAVE